jgi:hypothetical protein
MGLCWTVTAPAGRRPGARQSGRERPRHPQQARRPRGIGWVGLIWLVPGLGALIYAGFGVNRLRRRAIGLRRPPPGSTSTGTLRARPSQADLVAARPGLVALARLGERVGRRPLVTGNRVTPLCNGEQAYPAMLGAIEGATASVCLSSFIFAPDVIGRRFVEALAAAVRRGVAVRVLVDAAGVRYSWPPIHRVLRRAGVPVARFLPITSGRGLAFFNLRNHRKILVADGRVAFCGGSMSGIGIWSIPGRTGPRATCSSVSRARWSGRCRRPSPRTGRSSRARSSRVPRGIRRSRTPGRPPRGC